MEAGGWEEGRAHRQHLLQQLCPLGGPNPWGASFHWAILSLPFVPLDQR